MKRAFLLSLALAGLLAVPAQAQNPRVSSKANDTLRRMFVLNGHFGHPPYASDPFTCDATTKRITYYNTTSNNVFFCNGTAWTSMGGLTSPVAGDYVWTGKHTYGSAADAANSVRLGETAGAIIGEGATADAFETFLAFGDATADNTLTITGQADVALKATTGGFRFIPGSNGSFIDGTNTAESVAGFAIVPDTGVFGTISTGGFNFSSTANDARASYDVGIGRSAAGVLRVTDGAAGNGSLLVGASVGAANSSQIIGSTGCIEHEGTVADAFETNLCFTSNVDGTLLLSSINAIGIQYTASGGGTQHLFLGGTAFTAPSVAVNVVDSGLVADSGNLGMLESGKLALVLTDSTLTYRVPSDYLYSWSSATNNLSAFDTGLRRLTPGVITHTGATSTSIGALLGGGGAVASAAGLPQPTGRVFHVTGTTTVTSINSTGFISGACITIIFDGILTFTDGSNLKLAGNFVTTADDTISLCYDGTNWYETARAVN